MMHLEISCAEKSANRFLALFFTLHSMLTSIRANYTWKLFQISINTLFLKKESPSVRSIKKLHSQQPEGRNYNIGSRHLSVLGTKKILPSFLEFAKIRKEFYLLLKEEEPDVVNWKENKGKKQSPQVPLRESRVVQLHKLPNPLPYPKKKKKNLKIESNITKPWVEKKRHKYTQHHSILKSSSQLELI